MSSLRERIRDVFRRRRYVPPSPPPLQELPLPHKLRRQHTELPQLRQKVERRLVWQENDVSDKAAPKFRVFEQHDLTTDRCSWFLQVFNINFKAIFHNDDRDPTNYAILYGVYDRYHHTARGRMSTVGKRMLRRQPVNFQQKFMRKFRQHLGVLPFMESTLGASATQGVAHKIRLLETLFRTYTDVEISGLKTNADKAVIAVFLQEIDAFLLSLHATRNQLMGELMRLRKMYVMYMIQWYLLAAMVKIYNEEKRPCSDGKFFRVNYGYIMSNFNKTLADDPFDATTLAGKPLTPTQINQIRIQLSRHGRTSKRMSLQAQSVSSQDPRVPPSFSRSASARSYSAIERSMTREPEEPLQDWDDPRNAVGFSKQGDQSYSRIQKQARREIQERLQSNKPFESHKQLIRMRTMLNDTLGSFRVFKWHQKLLEKVTRQLQKVQQGKD